jgi:hypothetical protein
MCACKHSHTDPCTHEHTHESTQVIEPAMAVDMSVPAVNLGVPVVIVGTKVMSVYM